MLIVENLIPERGTVYPLLPKYILDHIPAGPSPVHFSTRYLGYCEKFSNYPRTVIIPGTFKSWVL